LAGYWSFDDVLGQDNSGNHLHINQKLRSGPPFNQVGQSTEIGGDEFISIPPGEELDSRQISITFWVYLKKQDLQDPRVLQGLRWCPLLYKGDQKTVDGNSIEVRSPAVFLDRLARNLRVYFSNEQKQGNEQGSDLLVTNSRIPYERWTHIAIVKYEKEFRVYFNGILDSVVDTKFFSVANDQPLYVGNHPQFLGNCTIPGYIDELRYYVKPLSEDEVIAEASFSQPNFWPAFVKLGCLNCKLSFARSVCENGYHLCTTIELNSVGINVARSLGWTDINSKVWSYSSPKNSGGDDLGVGICCVDI